MSFILEEIKTAFKISRFRFWFYLAGPFTVGCIWGAKRYLDLLNLEFFVFLFYFLFPANILLYGVNDYYDRETDIINPKKGEKEQLISEKEREKVKIILLTVLISSLLLFFFMKNVFETVIFSSFLLLSIFYSARPLRFKTIPILDSASNFLYALPGIFAFYQVSGSLPILAILIAAFLHTFAMHLFSAIPDIEYDRNTGMKTTAVLLGKKKSLFICALLWTGFSAIVLIIGRFSIFSVLTLIYPLNVIHLIGTGLEVNSIYWYYPYINTGLGGLLFLIKAIQTPW
jgi:4-hydroxybenzoate polyprenyltransferase